MRNFYEQNTAGLLSTMIEIDSIMRKEIRQKQRHLQQLRAENYLNEVVTAESVVETVLKKFYPDEESVFESNWFA